VTVEQQQHVIDLLVQRAPSHIDRDYREGSRCVAATRIAYDVLRYFGIRGKALPVEALAANAPAWEAIREATQRGEPLTREQEDELVARGAWYVQIDTETNTPGRYAGHLVLGIEEPIFDGERGFVDLDLQQFRREQKGILLPDAISASVFPEWWTGEAEARYPLAEDGMFIVRRLREYRPFQHTPDWKRQHPCVGPLIREIRAEVAGGG
jgi:hypothetical protein